jgi:hypothetical protein
MRVNRPVYLNTLRCFLDSPARLVASALLMLLAYSIVGGAAHIFVNGAQTQSGVFDTPASALVRYGNVVFVLVAWILGVGVIRKEISSGSIQLVMLRPLTRSSYILSKWAALATLNLGFLLFVYAVLLIKGGASLASPDLLAVFGAQAAQALALAAVLTFLSSVPSPLGEAGLLLLGLVALAVLGHFASGAEPWDSLIAGGYRVLLPTVGLEGRSLFFGMFALEPAVVDSASSLLFNLAVSAAALAGAMALLARREFHYAQTGG